MSTSQTETGDVSAGHTGSRLVRRPQCSTVRLCEEAAREMSISPPSRKRRNGNSTDMYQGVPGDEPSHPPSVTVPRFVSHIVRSESLKLP